MTVWLMSRGTARPSLRQLASAAGVTVPTLRHYFGDRSDVIEAILAGYREAGEQRLRAIAEIRLPFDESIHEYGRALLAAVRAPRPVKLGDVFAVSLAEGLLDGRIGPAALEHVVDPSLEVLQARLAGHIEAGEMIPTDTRAAALMLLSPLLLVILHQHQMGGADCSPADLDAIAHEVCTAFVRAYAARH
jgi:AcrR family transcriptional regulator